MNYQETLEYLFTRLPMYQRDGKKAYKADLSNTLQLLAYLDNPQNKFKSIHIAGTNGKGTSAHAIASILQSAGYVVGLYTSPHLKNFTERIRISGIEVSKDFVTDFVERIKPAIEKIGPSFFEITVAMAFEYFSVKKVDIAVIETGLGGRLDSTNVITPEVSLITNIGYDHMDLLGDTLSKIAAEKAGIIKSNVPVVISERQSEVEAVFIERARQVDAPITFAESSKQELPDLSPSYLQKNLAGVEAVIAELQSQGWAIKEDHIKRGIANMNRQTGLKGRFQVLSNTPLTIADVSHNKDGLKVLLDQVATLNKGVLHLVFGTVKDKNLSSILSLIPAYAKYYWTQSKVPRSLPVEELAIQAVVRGKTGDCFKDVNEAITAAKVNAKAEDMVVVTGSTFVIAEIEGL